MNLEAIEELKIQAKNQLEAVADAQQLEAFRLTYLTKKGPIQQLLKDLGSLAPEEKKTMGQVINRLRDEIQLFFDEKRRSLEEQQLQESLAKETIDVTLPGKREPQGSLHPVMRTLDKALTVLSEMGFSIHYGPNVDDDYHNFEALNFPPDHPARDMQDTFYVSTGELLRTQTSNTQVRLMKELELPIRVAVPGRCFRSETITARSHVMFHQIEGLCIDKDISMADLLATLETFYQKLFDQKLELRVRPSYFPFVEPGIEVDVSCVMCKGKGCSVCKHSGWLEIAGAGMVHPHVLKEGGIDPEVYSGFAWGMGLERLVMILHGIDDIRLFTQNDLRFLSQFAKSNA